MPDKVALHLLILHHGREVSSLNRGDAYVEFIETNAGRHQPRLGLGNSAPQRVKQSFKRFGVRGIGALHRL